MNHSFKVKLLGLALVAASLVYYQTVITARATLVDEREQTIARVEAYNTSVLEQQNSAEEEETGLQDGVYEGKGNGFGGKVRISVTIQGGKITSIDVVDASNEDDAYLIQAETILDDMIAAQSAEVDTVSGATCTADGLIEAAQDALGKAVQ